MMTKHEVLLKLYQRIQDPKRWAGYQVTATGGVRFLPNGELACGCVLEHVMDIRYPAQSNGAYPQREVVARGPDVYKDLQRAMYGAESEGSVALTVGEWNDRHTHGEVLEAVHKAMREAAP